mgnify:CR=1 FL=1
MPTSVEPLSPPGYGDPSREIERALGRCATTPDFLDFGTLEAQFGSRMLLQVLPP